jgi:hypothetical protein
MNLEPLKMMVTHSFEMLGTTYPAMQKLRCCKDPRSHTDVLILQLADLQTILLSLTLMVCFVPQVMARRVELDGRTRVLVHWYPEDM